MKKILSPSRAHADHGKRHGILSELLTKIVAEPVSTSLSSDNSSENENLAREMLGVARDIGMAPEKVATAIRDLVARGPQSHARMRLHVRLPEIEALACKFAT